MAVRLDIRPRLVLRDEPVAKVRRGVRLPPLTFPALGYWLAMGVLTYFFAHLAEHPLESAFASPDPELGRADTFEPASPPAVLRPALAPLPEPSPRLEPAPAVKAAPEPTPSAESKPEP